MHITLFVTPPLLDALKAEQQSFTSDIPHWPSHSEEYLTSYNRM